MSNPEPTNQVVTTDTEPALIGPLTRFMRTVLQILVALIAAVPTAAAAFNVSAQTSAKFVGFMGGVVAIMSALQNAFNSKQAT